MARPCIRLLMVFLLTSSPVIALAEVVTFDATIRGVDSKNRTLTVRKGLKDQGKDIELDVSRTALITVDGRPSTLEGLKAGQRAVVSYESSLEIATKVEVGGGGPPVREVTALKKPGTGKPGYRFVELTIERDGSGEVVVDSRSDRPESDSPEEAGTPTPGIEGLKGAEVTRLKDGRLRVVHDFQEIREVEDLKSPTNAIDKRQHRIDAEGGVLVLTPVPQAGGKVASDLSYPRQVTLPMQLRMTIADYGEDGFFGVPINWPNSLLNHNFFGNTPDKKWAGRVVGSWLMDRKKPDEWNTLIDFQARAETLTKESFRIPLTGPQADERLHPRIGVVGKGPLKIRRIEVVARVVGRVGIALDERGGQVVVTQVLEGAGARAGVRPGDELKAVDGYESNRMAIMMTRLGRVGAGEPATLTVLRDGKNLQIRVVAD